MAGTMRTRKAEGRLLTAAPKIAQALTELNEALDDPFGPLSVYGAAQSNARDARNELLTAAMAVRDALESLHELNTKEATR